MATSPKYHLTHRNLVGERFEPEEFGSAKIALIGFCPPPAVLSKYKPRTVTDQHFIHASPNSVRKFTHGTMTLLSLAHVYGGPAASATVEELSYYGFKYILAYGLAGGLGTRSIKMGDYYLVENAIAADGTTRQYQLDPATSLSVQLMDQVLDFWQVPGREELKMVRAATDDAILQGR